MERNIFFFLQVEYGGPCGFTTHLLHSLEKISQQLMLTQGWRLGMNDLFHSSFLQALHTFAQWHIVAES